MGAGEVNLITTLCSLIHETRRARLDRVDREERAAVARAFNDRYTYRIPYRYTDATLPGTFYGVPHSTGFAWMCSGCNMIHHPIADSVFSGLQYPACCTHPEGNRLYERIKTK